MLHITCSALVPYSAEQMFSLVNNISTYSEFIPGCTASQVLKQNDSEVTAEINVSKAGISKSFITRNIIMNNHSIAMRLVKGPFSSFTGDWRFIPLSKEASKVEFHLDFEFKNKLIEITFGCIFKEMTNNMVMAFTRRAKEVYNV
ncbi:MAG: ribosome association toxin RatA [Sodalis sp. Fse]|nr:MAG: ribosome association toxin RatA [Sodalis sp. Fse]UVK79207.1 MAG: ribosome association toxin RatA [Sodalis sp. Ffu]